MSQIPWNPLAFSKKNSSIKHFCNLPAAWAHPMPESSHRLIQLHNNCRVNGPGFASKFWVCDGRSKVCVFLKKRIFIQMKNSCFWSALPFLPYQHLIYCCRSDLRLVGNGASQLLETKKIPNQTDVGLSHFPRARKQLFLIRGIDNCCCIQLPLRKLDLRAINPFSFSYKNTTQAAIPACHVLLLVLASSSSLTWRLC